MSYKVQQWGVYDEKWTDAVLNPVMTDWQRCTFETKREAEIYAYLWCNDVSKEIAAIEAPEFVMLRPTMFATCIGEVHMLITEV